MQKIFINGNILTMSDKCPNPEAVLVEGRNIIRVGSREEVMKAAGRRAAVIDLKGRTLLPGFFDAHGHFISYALSQLKFVDLRCVPVGKIRNVEQMIQALKIRPETKEESLWALGMMILFLRMEEWRRRRILTRFPGPGR